MNAGIKLLSFTIALLIAAPSACKRSSAPAGEPKRPIPALGPVTIQDFTPDPLRPQGVKIDTTALEQRVRKSLLDSGLFTGLANDGGAAVALRVRIEMGLEDVVADAKAAARAVLRLRIDTRPSEKAAVHWNEDVQAGAETEYETAANPDRRELFNKLVRRSVDDLLSGYISRQKLWSGDPAALRQTLNADAGELQIEAIRAVGERKLSSEAPALLKLLEHSDESVRDAALGALVELKDRRAVAVLASQRSMRDRREMRKILDAIATLGGKEASEYLSFVAEGHDDPEIRELAASARARLQRRNEK
jgi:HEAT repeat protein